jgi:peptidoglycan-associated lipoprotein
VFAVSCASAEKRPDAPVGEPAPAAEPAPPTPDADAFLIPPEAGPVYFTFDQHLLDEGSRQNLAEVARYMTDTPDVLLSIDGHCDAIGTSEYNLALGDKRAQAARSYLVALGVAETRVRVISWGEERPAVSGTDSEARALNRRDELTLYIQGDTTASLDDLDELSALDVVMAWSDWDR